VGRTASPVTATRIFSHQISSISAIARSPHYGTPIGSTLCATWSPTIEARANRRIITTASVAQSVSDRAPSLRAASQANSGAVNIRLTGWEDHRSRPFWDTGGAVNPLTDWVDHRSRPFWDTGTSTSRKAVTVSLTPVTASCRPDMRWAARPAAGGGHRERTAIASLARTGRAKSAIVPR
jgi:hypothetical protein